LIATVERIGVCRSKGSEATTLFHRVKVKLSRKYRVWPVPGDDRYIELDPSEYLDRYITVQQYQPRSAAHDDERGLSQDVAQLRP